jgi:hypothetical protein
MVSKTHSPLRSRASIMVGKHGLNRSLWMQPHDCRTCTTENLYCSSPSNVCPPSHLCCIIMQLLSLADHGSLHPRLGAQLPTDPSKSHPGDNTLQLSS